MSKRMKNDAVMEKRKEPFKTDGYVICTHDQKCLFCGEIIEKGKQYYRVVELNRCDSADRFLKTEFVTPAGAYCSDTHASQYGWRIAEGHYKHRP